MTVDVDETIIEALDRANEQQMARDAAIIALLTAILEELKKGKK